MNFKKLFQINSFSSDSDARMLAAEILQQQYNCEINAVEIDETVLFAHNGKGCTIAAAKISAGTVIFQNVTIGANQTYNRSTKRWENLGNPVIGKNVIIADDAKIVGPIIIGDNSIIGMGAIITKDVPENSIAFGVNQIKPANPGMAPIYYSDMPTREDQIAAAQDLITRYHTQATQ